MPRRAQGGGTGAQGPQLAGIHVAAQRVLTLRAGAVDRPQGGEQFSGRRRPARVQLAAEPQEPLPQSVESGDGRFYACQVLPDQARGVDSGVKADSDGFQAQPQATKGQHLVQTDEVFLRVLPVPARRAPRGTEQTDAVPVVQCAYGQSTGLGQRPDLPGLGSSHEATMHPHAA